VTSGKWDKCFLTCFVAVFQGFGISRRLGVFWWVQQNRAGSVVGRRPAGYYDMNYADNDDWSFS